MTEKDYPKTRVEEWQEFSKAVEEHIKSYTMGQYGDKGNDLSTNKSYSFCWDQIEKYVKRRGNNARENQDLLDLKKIAHYCCIGYWKFIENPEEQKEKFTVFTKNGIIDEKDMEMLMDIDRNKNWKITLEEI